jgi:hypothetical protein
VTFASPAVQLTSLAPSESTGTEFLIGAGGTSLYSITGGGVVTAIKTGLTNNARWEWVSAPVVSGQGPNFGLNGVDTPQQWSGSGNTVAWTATDSGGAVPNGKYSLVHQNQVLVTGTVANPSRVYWSGIADPTAWNPLNLNGSGFADFDPNDGEAISGMGTVGPYVLIAKPRKLWILVDTATATIRRLAENVGVSSHRSIAEGPEGTYFLAEDRGVYLTNGTKTTAISDVIQPTIDSFQNRALANGQYFNGHYLLSGPILSASNDTTLDWDVALQSWWKHSFGSNDWSVWHSGGGGTAPSLYSAKGTSAIVDQCFVPSVYTDNGANFTFRWAGPWQSPTFYRRRRFPTPYFRKRLRQVRVDGTGQVDFSLAKDFATTETLVRSDIFGYSSVTDNFAGAGNYAAADGTFFGGMPTEGHARIHSQGVARAFSNVFSSTAASPAAIYEYVLMITDRKDLVVS